VNRRSLIRVLLVIAAAVTASALAANGARASTLRPVLVGFEDEPSFIWASNRIDRLATAGESGANVIRVIANWATIAPKQPSNASSPADPAYRFNWLDDLVWQAQHRGMRVLLTIWGTPPWASSTHKPNAAPQPATLGAFCGALAARYSGRYVVPDGTLAPVTLFSVWNEPNLAQFLSPQYIGKKDASPRLYANMFRACEGAIKRANSSALVAAGETSPRGTDHPRGGIQQSHSPGRFAQLVAAQRPVIHFDAWAHHPYGTGFTGRATVPFRWPNVGVSDLKRLEGHLSEWFHRKTVPIWITEFAYQTRPGALTLSQQASYLRAAFLKAVSVQQVQMFIWFVFEDTPGQLWQSGLYTANNTPKPALSAWESVTAPYSVDNPHMQVRKGVSPSVTLPLVVLQNYRLPTDPKLGVEWHVYQGTTPVVGANTETTLSRNGYATIKLSQFRPIDGRYTVRIAINDIHGNVVNRVVSLNTIDTKVK
jgi:hypothetical protein